MCLCVCLGSSTHLPKYDDSGGDNDDDDDDVDDSAHLRLTVPGTHGEERGLSVGRPVFSI